MEKKWYAVYTRPRWEKKVADSLSRIEVENYCPLNKVERRWSDRKKIVEEPLFTSYVFIRITSKEQGKVREVDGLLNLVYWLGKPAVIRDEEIDLIKKFLNIHKNVRLENTNVNVKDKVKIRSGPFMEMQGEVLSVKRKTVTVNLPSLGYFLIAEIEKNELSIISCSPSASV
jgi:transcription antitermination factor NusG